MAIKMHFRNHFLLSSIFLIYLFTNCTGKSFEILQSQNKSIENSSAFIQFNPYVSILDKIDKFRYNVTSLMPFVSKVTTRFSRIFVLLTELDLEADLETSLALSPLAIARYNSLLHNSSSDKSKLEVWLAYSSIQPESTYRNDFKHHKDPMQLKSLMENLANKANNIFSGTVTTILLPYTLLRVNLEKILLNSTTDKENRFILFPSSTYRWGTLLDSPECTYSSHYMTALEKVRLEVVIMMLVHSTIDDLKNNEFFEEFQRILHHCRNYISAETPKGFLVRIPDTDTYAAENLTRLVTTWKNSLNWFKERNLQLIISKAFDTPYEDSVEMKTSGLWRLKENIVYNKSTDFVFEEKALIVKRAEAKPHQNNLDWLKDDIKFSKLNTGIIFSAYSAKILDCPEEDMEIVLTQIVNTFSKIVIEIQDPSSFGIKVMLFEIRNLVKLQGKMEIIQLVLMPQVIFETVVPKGWDHVANKHQFSKLLFSTYVLQFTGEETFKYATYYKNAALANINSTNYKLGFAFNITICQLYDRMGSYNASLIDKALNEAQVIYFLFEEDIETVKLGATRMFIQRRILMEQCQKLLNSVNHSVASNNIIYVLFHYPVTVTSEFYSSSWRLQNFVKYWMLLNEWAEMINTTVIFNNAIDGKKYIKETETTPAIGWWRYQDIITNENRNRWKDKRQYALEISTQSVYKVDEDYGDSYIAILISIIIMVVVVMVTFPALSMYVIFKYKRKSNLLREKEDATFLLGSLDTEDRSYELEEGTFTVYEDECLGTGEFGKVCRGRIATTSGYKRVAVKINKAEKDTSLKGILAEIKILIHVGKHENITELLGVNTANLKNGKVLMFLELCQLGSLQRYLRNHHQPSKREEIEQNVLNNYANLRENLFLDDSQKKDLYRWSKEICNGMAYLAMKKVVHDDLATRNVLLDANKVVKLCDFGLSRKLYDDLSYVKTTEEGLPWKWMAPEALRLKEFNEKTDVWSYGITLWEIYSLGDTPYTGYTLNLEFVNLLEGGLCLNEPWFSDKTIYSLMKECWNIDPKQRPTFAEIITKFG